MNSDISDNNIHTIRKQIGQIIRQARRDKGISQRALANASSCSQADLSQFENGQGNLGKERAERIAEILHLDVKRILAGTYLSPQPAAAPPSPSPNGGAFNPAGGAPPPAGLPKIQTPGNAPE